MNETEIRATLKDIGIGLDTVENAAYIGQKKYTCIKQVPLMHTNFSSYDTIVWDISDYQSEINLPHNVSEKLFTLAEENLSLIFKKLDDFFNTKGILILFPGVLNTVTVAAKSATKNLTPTKIQELVNLFKPTPNLGDKISCAAAASQNINLGKTVEHLSYNYSLESKLVTPLFVDSRSQHVVGGYKFTQTGGIIMMVPRPPLNAYEYFCGLIEIARHLIGNNTSTTALEPEWSSKLVLENEIKLVKENQKIQEEINEKKALIDSNNTALIKLRGLKELYFGHGDNFCYRTKQALEEIGLQIEFGPQGHADLLAKHDKKLILIETKGISGGARKSDISQAAGWGDEVEQILDFGVEELSDFHVEYKELILHMGFDIEALRKDRSLIKRLIILNTYRNKPLSSRTDPAFPEAALNEMKSRRVAGMTSLQLLSVLIESQKNESLKTTFIDALVEKNQPLEGFDDWTKILTSIE